MKILITDGLESEAIAILRKQHEVDVKEVDPKGLLDVVAGYHALIVRSRTIVSKAVLTHAPNLKVVGRGGSAPRLRSARKRSGCASSHTIRISPRRPRRPSGSASSTRKPSSGRRTS